MCDLWGKCEVELKMKEKKFHHVINLKILFEQKQPQFQGKNHKGRNVHNLPGSSNFWEVNVTSAAFGFGK